MCAPKSYILLIDFCFLGWDLTAFFVWRGYLITIGWSAGFLILAAIILRIKQ